MKEGDWYQVTALEWMVYCLVPCLARPLEGAGGIPVVWLHVAPPGTAWHALSNWHWSRLEGLDRNSVCVCGHALALSPPWVHAQEMKSETALQ